LAELVTDACKLGCQRFVLERLDRHLDHTDRQTITRALNLARPLAADDGTGDFSCEHLQPHEEPALWIPDAVAWAMARVVCGARV
jgi:hypothetical protein